MEAKDKWVNSILESSDGMQQVAPNEALLSKINSRINAEQPIPILTRWMVAASIVILISLNITLASQESKVQEKTEISSLVENNGNQLY